MKKERARSFRDGHASLRASSREREGKMVLTIPRMFETRCVKDDTHRAPSPGHCLPRPPNLPLPDEVHKYPDLPPSVAAEYHFCWRKLLRKSDIRISADVPVVPLSFLMDEYYGDDDDIYVEGRFIFSVSENSDCGTLVHIDYAKDSDERGMRAEELLKKLVLEYPDCCVGVQL
ncbi:uncharacterized protein ARMOST_20244 [Armillaria ostoyae]|uniref:Uncharacterized protein n=1 Tax=Armillaria ostoyae TaxID=47428 RepID=A0A284RQL0_ARMOS|nr:uncharacterized protein ARMOST_14460 [Armillaria ostoyae]SJL16715.1 uncharacterized protein ARMOST_20244 [Armillaria ostoyae]